MNIRENIAIQIFPVLQTGAFVMCVYFFDKSPMVAILFFILSIILLNFTLHITVHHFVHHSAKNKRVTILVELLYTLLLAFPYTYYRMLHFNHHRYNNGIGDLTSTWVLKNGKIQPRHFVLYSFFWFYRASLSTAKIRLVKDGDASLIDFQKVRFQVLFLVGFFGLLFYLNPLILLLYFLSFYSGWCLISITNYGQHLPLIYGEPIAYSFRNTWFNKLLFNHGLHLEHHLHPSKEYRQLQAKQEATISRSFLVVGLLKKRKWRKL